MASEFEKIRFHDFRKFDRDLLRKAVATDEGYKGTVGQLIQYLGSVTKSSEIDEEKLYILGRNVGYSLGDNLRTKLLMETGKNESIPYNIREIFASAVMAGDVPETLKPTGRGNVIHLDKTRRFLEPNNISPVCSR